jgi:hypothetical protein
MLSTSACIVLHLPLPALNHSHNPYTHTPTHTYTHTHTHTHTHNPLSGLHRTGAGIMLMLYFTINVVFCCQYVSPTQHHSITSKMPPPRAHDSTI